MVHQTATGVVISAINEVAEDVKSNKLQESPTARASTL
jgi:hypothetical protein